MKILQVTNFFKPSWESGGPARVAYEISKNLVERGHDVTVYTTDGFKWRLNVAKNKPVNVDGIKTYYFRNMSGYLAAKVFPTPYYASIVARKEIKNFDVIHIHENNTLGFIVHHYAKKYGIPYVLQGHGSLLIQMRGKKRLVGRIWNIILEGPTLYDASKVIALTETEAEQCKKMGVSENKIETVPNGIDLSDYNNILKKSGFKKKFGIKNDEKIILYVGRLNKTKGIDLLIKTFAQLSKETNNIKLVLLGPDDGYQAQLKNFIHKLKVTDKVLLTGFVDNDVKMAAFTEGDVFVTPSFSGFPVTFLEACACGIPIVTTNNADKLDWIQDKVGYVVEYDEIELKGAILKILTDENLGKRFGEEGRKVVNERFNWDTIVNKIEDIYKNMIKNREIS